MADDVLISDEISKDAAVAALESLQKKGMDLNPYSLADELEVDHRAIVGNGEIMQMLSYARGDVNGIVAAEYDKLLRRVTELEEAQKNGGDSSEEDSDELDEELERLREKNSKLEEQVKALENANQVLALSMQDLAVPKKEEQDSEDRYNEGFEAAKKEMEAAIASASDEAFLKGYDAAKEELKDSNSSEETDEERFNEGFEAARKSLEGELLKSKEESYKEGYEAGKAEQPEPAEAEKSAEESYNEGYQAAKAELDEELNKAKEQSYQEGFDAGKEQSYQEGFDAGKEQSYQEGFATAKSEAEEEVARAREKAWQKGYEKAQKEFETQKSTEQSAEISPEALQEEWQKGYDAARAELEETLAQSQQEMWQQGYDAGKQEALGVQPAQSAEQYEEHVDEPRIELPPRPATTRGESTLRDVPVKALQQEAVDAMADFLVGSNSAVLEAMESVAMDPEMIADTPVIGDALPDAFEGQQLLNQDAGESEGQPKWTVDDTQAITQGYKIPNYLKDMAHELGNDLGEPMQPPGVPDQAYESNAFEQNDANAQGYDPSAQGYDANAQAYDANAQAYDANAQEYDANAQGYDANAQGYDANAQAYDPNAQGYDPNAQGYDPSAQGYDPNAQAYDPNAQGYDPNAQGYDPSAQGYDPNAQAYDPSAQAYDPNAQAYDPNAQGYDPNAQAYDPNAQAYDANAQGYDPNAQAYDPNAQSPDPAMQPYDPYGKLPEPMSPRQDMPQYDGTASYNTMPQYDPMADPSSGLYQSAAQYDGGVSYQAMPAYESGADGASYQNAPQYDGGFGKVSGGFGDPNAVEMDSQVDSTHEHMPEEATAGAASEGVSKAERSKTSEFDPNELRNLVQGRLHHKDEPAEGEAAGPKSPLKKFVGGKHQPTQEHNAANMPRVVSPDIRRACKLLGLRPEELLNKAVVLEAWKREMAKPGVHPDTGGDTEMAMYLNNAKDTLVRYLDAQAPKLGKVFGSKTTDHGNKDNPKGDKS